MRMHSEPSEMIILEGRKKGEEVNISKKISSFWSMSFKDRVLEAEYKDSRKKYHETVLVILSLFNAIFISLKMILDPLERDYEHYPERFLTNCIAFPLIILPLLILKIKPKRLDIILFVKVLFNVFLILESFHIRKKTMNPFIFFIYGSVLNCLMMTLLLAKLPWKFTMSASMACLISLIFRYFDVEMNQRLNYLPLGMFITITFIYSFASVLLERNDRESFKEIKLYELSLWGFKNVISQVFPCSFFILKDKKIDFKNDVLDKLFQDLDYRSHKPEISFSLDLAKQIKLEWDVNSASLNNLWQQGSAEEMSDDRKDNLFDLIMRNKLESILELNKFFHLHGEFQPTDADVFYFDIEVGSVLWEEEKALMVILGENKSVSKIKALNKEALNKDRVLAKVSHELRTPLNGLIGMIEASLELVKEEEIKKR